MAKIRVALSKAPVYVHLKNHFFLPPGFSVVYRMKFKLLKLYSDPHDFHPLPWVPPVPLSTTSLGSGPVHLPSLGASCLSLPDWLEVTAAVFPAIQPTTSHWLRHLCGYQQGTIFTSIIGCILLLVSSSRICLCQPDYKLLGRRNWDLLSVVCFSCSALQIRELYKYFFSQ